MRKWTTLAMLASMAFFALLCVSSARAETPEETILRNSDWNIVIDGMQHGGVRIRNGVIYPGNTRLNNPVGEVAFAPSGELYLLFVNHPKIVGGEALVAKNGNGKWSGPLMQGSNQRSLVLSRTHCF